MIEKSAAYHYCTEFVNMWLSVFNPIFFYPFLGGGGWKWIFIIKCPWDVFFFFFTFFFVTFFFIFYWLTMFSGLHVGRNTENKWSGLTDILFRSMDTINVWVRFMLPVYVANFCISFFLLLFFFIFSKFVNINSLQTFVIAVKCLDF